MWGQAAHRFGNETARAEGQAAPLSSNQVTSVWDQAVSRPGTHFVPEWGQETPRSVNQLCIGPAIRLQLCGN